MRIVMRAMLLLRVLFTQQYRPRYTLVAPYSFNL
ncbi:MAG: hypothetical protein ACI89T_001166 [Cognaticolwellia sp.]|jgi:hypothetical protein